MAQNDMKELAIVVKADVQGCCRGCEAEPGEDLSNDEVRVRVIHAGVGAISKSDVDSGRCLQRHHHRLQCPPGQLWPRPKPLPGQGVEMRMYRVIYDAINDVSDAMKGMLAPKVREVVPGRSCRSVRCTRSPTLAPLPAAVLPAARSPATAQVRVVRDGIVICRGRDRIPEALQG